MWQELIKIKKTPHPKKGREGIISRGTTLVDRIIINFLSALKILNVNDSPLSTNP